MELHLVLVSWDTGEGWSNRAGKVAYESRRDYIIAVKGKMSASYLKYPERVGGISTSGDLWCGVVHDGVFDHLVLHAVLSTSDKRSADLICTLAAAVMAPALTVWKSAVGQSVCSIRCPSTSSTPLTTPWIMVKSSFPSPELYPTRYGKEEGGEAGGYHWSAFSGGSMQIATGPSPRVSRR